MQNYSLKLKIIIIFLGIFTGLFFLAKTSQTQASNCSTDINNNAVCPPLTDAPILPAAGGKFTDPDFGTEIIRVTDRNDGDRTGVAYSYWNLFNVDSTKFVVFIDGTTYLYNFNKNTDTIAKLGRLLPEGSPILSPEGLIWSAKDPNILYGFVTMVPKLYKYNVATKEYTVMKDFSAIWPGTYIWQTSMSEDDDVFAFTIRRSSDYAELGAGYYKVSTDTYGRYDCIINEAQVDKSGTYVSIYHENAADPTWTIWNIKDNSKQTIPWGNTWRPPGHYDQGFGKIFGASAWSGFNLRDLSNPQTWTMIWDLGWGRGLGWHISWRNNDDTYAYLSNLSVDTLTDAALENEIIQIFLDGSQRYRRLAHHRSVGTSYSDYSMAAVDRLGKYILFMSNWGSSTYRDVFILKIPAQFQASTPPDTTPPAPPSGVTVN